MDFEVSPRYDGLSCTSHLFVQRIIIALISPADDKAPFLSLYVGGYRVVDKVFRFSKLLLKLALD